MIHRALRFSALMLLWFSTAVVSRAQQDTADGESSILGLPLVFYTPETRWGFGAAGIYNFKFDYSDTISPPSQLQLGFAYTQEDQLLSYLPFQLYWNRRKYSLTGELGYYRYSYFYYGIGNDVPQDFEELYFVNYPRIRIQFMRKLQKYTFAGVRYWFEDFDMRQIQSDGRLATQNVTGSKGSITSGLGLVFSYDSRDNVYYSSTGFFAEAVVQPFTSWMGSGFEFTKYSTDFRYFIPLSDRFILGNSFYAEKVTGNPPFNMLALLGGTKRMRGYYEGRYRDQNLVLFMTEFRTDIYWRLGAVAFFNVGNVAPEISAFEIENTRYTYGGGVRFTIDPERKVNIRFDVGVTQTGSVGYYLTFGEAF